MRTIRNLNPNDCNMRINGLIRLKERRWACVETSKFWIDSVEKTAQKIPQKIGESKRMCCEETHRARQARVDELCMHQERNLATVNELLAQIHDLQNKMRHNITILNHGAVLERPTFPVNPPLFRVPEPRLAVFLDCRVIHGTSRVLQETFFERPSAQEGRSSTLFNNSRIWHHRLRDWDLISQEVQGNKRVKWDENRKNRQYWQASVHVVFWLVRVVVIFTWLHTTSRGSSCARVSRHPCMWWASLFDFEFSIPSDFLFFSFSFNLLQSLLLFFHFLEDSSNTAYSAKMEMGLLTNPTSARSQLTNLWHRDWLWIRFLRLRCVWCDDCDCIEKTSWQAHSLSQERKSKSSVVRIPTESVVADKLHTLRISVLPKPTKRHKESQICSL